jgi:mannan endo-1,4-beta-mannosidase
MKKMFRSAILLMFAVWAACGQEGRGDPGGSGGTSAGGAQSGGPSGGSGGTTVSSGGQVNGGSGGVGSGAGGAGSGGAAGGSGGVGGGSGGTSAGSGGRTTGDSGGRTTGAGGSQANGGSGGAGGSGSGGANGGPSGGRGGSGGVAGAGGTTVRTGGLATGGGTGTGGTRNDASPDGPGTSCQATGFHVQGTKLYDKNCNEFIIRGVNYPYAWYTSDVEKRFSDVASVRSNTIRVVMATGGQWTRTSGSVVSSIISWAKSNKLIAMLEVHDSTGWSEAAKAENPDNALSYWLSSEIATVLKGNEAHVMINIANEAFGNNTTDQWEPFYTAAMPKLRNAGLHHTLVVDAPNWGQDWSFTMRDGGGPAKIFNADPDKNVVFSIHMYDVYNSASVVTDYITKFLAKGLPLIVGEFAADHGPGKEVDEGTILSHCQQKGVGYAGWSWSGNSADLASLDITNNFNVASLTTWGTRLIRGANGIEETAKVCTIFQ